MTIICTVIDVESWSYDLITLIAAKDTAQTKRLTQVAVISCRIAHGRVVSWLVWISQVDGRYGWETQQENGSNSRQKWRQGYLCLYLDVKEMSSIGRIVCTLCFSFSCQWKPLLHAKNHILFSERCTFWFWSTFIVCSLTGAKSWGWLVLFGNIRGIYWKCSQSLLFWPKNNQWRPSLLKRILSQKSEWSFG